VLAWEDFKMPVVLPLFRESKINPGTRSDTDKSLPQQTISLKQTQ